MYQLASACRGKLSIQNSRGAPASAAAQAAWALLQDTGGKDSPQEESTADDLENDLWQLLGPLLPEAFIQGFTQCKLSTNLALFGTGSEHYDSHIQ